MGRIRRKAVAVLYFIDTVTQTLVSGSSIYIQIRQKSPVIRKEDGCVVIMEQPGVDSLDIAVSGGSFSSVGLHVDLVGGASVQIRYVYLLPSPAYPFTRQMAVVYGTGAAGALYAVRMMDANRYRLMNDLNVGEHVMRLWGIDRFLQGQQLLLDEGEQYALVTLLEPDDDTEHGYHIMEQIKECFQKGKTKVYSVIRISPDESGRFCVAYDRICKDGETICFLGGHICRQKTDTRAGIKINTKVEIQEGQEIKINVGG